MVYMPPYLPTMVYTLAYTTLYTMLSRVHPVHTTVSSRTWMLLELRHMRKGEAVGLKKGERRG